VRRSHARVVALGCVGLVALLSVPKPVEAQRAFGAHLEGGIGPSFVRPLDVERATGATASAGVSLPAVGAVRVALELAATAGGDPIGTAYIPESSRPGDRSLTTLLLGVETPIQAHATLADTLRAVRSGDPRGQLSESAVQFVIDYAKLGWETSWNRPEDVRPHTGKLHVFAYVSPNDRYCILSRAMWSEWGQWGEAEYALIAADSGLVWRKQGGGIAAPPQVSDAGQTAIFETGGEMDIQLMHARRQIRYRTVTLLQRSGDTLMSKTWSNFSYRDLQRTALAECAAFSADGERFLMSMNLARTEASPDSEYCNTSLSVFNLREQTEREESVGPFTPWRVEMTSDDAVVRGVWGTPWIGGTSREGYCRVQFVPWKVTRHGTNMVNPSLPKVPSASSK